MIQYTIEKKTVMTGANPGEIKYYPKIVRATTMTTEKNRCFIGRKNHNHQG